MTDFPEVGDALLRVSGKAFQDEAKCVQALLPQAEDFASRSQAIHARAARYVEAVRAQKDAGALEAFQREYSLSSPEGILILCLAEALLRIPDAATADALIHDKLTPGDWDRHVGLGRPLLVSLGSRALGLAERLVDETTLRQSAGEFLASLMHRLGEPLVRGALKHAMGMLGHVFVLGGTMREAGGKAKPWRAKGYRFSFDMLGEGARTESQAEAYFASYRDAIGSLARQSGNDLTARDGISIKLSALHPRVELKQWRRLESELLPKLKALALLAAEQGIILTIDAEEATRLDVMLHLFTKLFTDPALASYQGLGLAVQAYQKRATHVIAYLGTLAQQTGRRIPLRLVKGAYWDSEIKRAQGDGLADYPVFTRKAHTDVSYLACAKLLLENPKAFYPQFATHNARTVASILEMAGEGDYEFQRLHGMGEKLYEVLRGETQRPCRIYAPVGASASLLSYLIRRILENGANTSFVHGLYDRPLAELLADPVAAAKEGQGTPAASIPLPVNLYPDRQNPRGEDTGNLAAQQRLYETLSKTSLADWALPAEADEQACDTAFAQAMDGFSAWRDTLPAARAACLRRIADAYEAHREELLALCVREAGKTLADSVGELREAIDYCRYYANLAERLLTPTELPHISGERNTLTLAPRGVFVAISPWNFPLAIFTGQIVAALVTGNAVIAKPAEQTPRIAARAVSLMHAAGVPEAALQLLCGSGETAGQALVGDARTSGVVFTGSTDTAWAINRTLAARRAPIAPFIAETGGQNCMIVDSSALIEQTVDDMIVSAFGSAGQRCSALRVAFMQEEIADTLLTVLAGAMAELRVGPAADAATDVGPVIDDASFRKLSRHIETLKQRAPWMASSPLPEDAAAQRLIAPHAFEIESIDWLEGEIFGPVLHVIRYRAEALDAVIAQVNATGFGLTFGIQSRIDERIRSIGERVRAGNVYVNRSMIGAVVGMQPFGGNGLSGTGPKAGGPHYLARFCQEQTLSVNTAAVGGNIELLA